MVLRYGLWLTCGALGGACAGYAVGHLPPSGQSALLGAVLGLAVAAIAILWLRQRGRFRWRCATVTIPLLGELEFDVGETGEATFAMDERQRQIGWRIYLQLVTRIGVQEVEGGTGSLRGSLSSLHALMQAVRRELRDVSPGPPPVGEESYTIETLAAWILNAIRALLAKWHQRLRDHEVSNGTENGFPHIEECQQDLRRLRETLTAYAQSLSRLLSVQGPEAFGSPPRAGVKVQSP